MVRVIMIVEMAGSPPSHVKDSLAKHAGVLEQVKDLQVHSIKVSEPKEIENSKGIFTCFAECDFEAPTFARLSETMFDFMPSSVEVIEPGKVVMDLHEASNMLNNLSGRLHRYDEIAKIAGFKIKQLTAELEQLKKGEKPSAKKKAIKKAAKKKKKKAVKKK